MAETAPVTHRNPVGEMSDREIAEEALQHLRNIDKIITELSPLLGEFRISGLLAVRRAARRVQ